jgi:hypothetical protein
MISVLELSEAPITKQVSSRPPFRGTFGLLSSNLGEPDLENSLGSGR